MKLLMVSGDRSILAGKQGAFWYTLREFRKHWDRIDIVCPKIVSPKNIEASEELAWQGDAVRFTQGHGGEVFFHPNPHGLHTQIGWHVRRARVLHQDVHFDVMTAHDYPPFYNGIAAKRIHRATGIPYAVEIHHIVGYPHSSSGTELIGRLLSRCFLAWDTSTASAVRVVNDEVGTVLRQWGVASEKIRLIPSFYLDHEIFAAVSQSAVRYDVAFCGRLVANKCLSNLLLALRQLSECRLVVIGDGPERSRLQRLTRKLGIRDRVAFLGWLPTQQDVLATIKSAKMFVMNSRSEGGPRVLLEAMACGMPVISTRVGIAPRVVEDTVNGFFTDGTPADLAAKIQYLLSNEHKRIALGTAARSVLAQYERSVLVKNYAQFLQSLA